MPTPSEIMRVLNAGVGMALEAGRVADELDPEECDEILEAIIDANGSLNTAAAYLRRRARPHTVSGYGESHDRLCESLDASRIARDREEADNCKHDDVSALVDQQEAWQAFVDDHPELGEAQEAPTTGSRIYDKPAPDPLQFDDDALVAAVAAGMNQGDWAPKNGLRALDAAEILAGQRLDCFKHMRSRPRHGDVVRVGQALSRLAREGRLRRVVRPHEGPSYFPAT